MIFSAKRIFALRRNCGEHSTCVSPSIALEFRDIRDLKKLLLYNEKQLARNLARQLAVYAAGAPMRFADREPIERILERASSSHYGVRSLIHELVQSELFKSK